MKVYDGSQTEQTQEPAPERVKVGIAEYEVTTGGEELTTSGLGSCVGLGLVDSENSVAGLIHVMLPESAEMTDGKPAKFADTGTELLVEEMTSVGASVEAMEAKLAGGSDMLDFSEGGSGIGERNVIQVRASLEEFGIPITGEDVGGDHGRSLRLEPQSGELVVKSANKENYRL